MKVLGALLWITVLLAWAAVVEAELPSSGSGSKANEEAEGSHLRHVSVLQNANQSMVNSDPYPYIVVPNATSAVVEAELPSSGSGSKANEEAEGSHLRHLSVLQNANQSMVNSDPYPYIVVPNALPEELYKRLEADFPSDKAISESARGKGHKMLNNLRYDMRAASVLVEDSPVSELWQQFVEYHTSLAFFKEVVDLFGHDLLRVRKELKHMKSSKRQWKVAVRTKEKKGDHMSLECQIAINSPVIKESTVRKAHYDNIMELYAGLLYMRHDNDDSTGGALEVYRCNGAHGRCKTATSAQMKKYNLSSAQKEFFAPPNLNLVNSIPYQKNTLVMFINSKQSIHGVSKRSKTKFSRRIINFTGNIPGASVPKGRRRRAAA